MSDIIKCPKNHDHKDPASKDFKPKNAPRSSLIVHHSSFLLSLISGFWFLAKNSIADSFSIFS